MTEPQTQTGSGGGQKPPGSQVTTTGGQPPGKPPIIVLRERLIMRTAEIKAALPSDISVEAFVRAVVTSASVNPDILACTWQSVWLACMRACRDGLLPDGTEGALVPYKGQASWQPMYRGMIRQFMRSGMFKWIGAVIVYEGETFERWVDENGEHFKHVPNMSNFGQAKIVAVYAAATTLEGAFFLAVMSIAEADKIRALSRNTREDAPWKNHAEEMYKKTALKRLAKLLPTSRDRPLPMIELDDEAAREIADVSMALPPEQEPEQDAKAAEGDGTLDQSKKTDEPGKKGGDERPSKS